MVDGSRKEDMAVLNPWSILIVFPCIRTQDKPGRLLKDY